MQPTILITRPEDSAISFASRVRARLGCGVRVVLSPLMQIEYQGSLPPLAGVRTLIFTSQHGVQAFAALTDQRDFDCYAVGNATADVARQLGLRIKSCQGDGQGLIAQVIADNAAVRCLHIRGEHAAVDIAKLLNQAGIETDTAILYRQIGLALEPQAAELLRGEKPVILPLFSPRSAKLFFQQFQPGAPLMVAAISEQVAQTVRETSVSALRVATRPDADAMLEAIDALCNEAKRLEGRNPAQ